MNQIIKFFLDNHKLTIILSILIVVFGLMGMSKINSESFPSVNFAMAQIETRYDGATAADIETKITKPIEDKIREVSGLKDIRSISQSGYSKIFVRVDMDNEDEDEVLDELQKAVKAVTALPSDLREEPKYIEVNSEEFPAVELAVVGGNLNRARDLMADALKEELEDSKKIKSVRLAGFTKRQFNIRLDEDKLKRFHIGIDEVLQKIRMRNIDVPGGELKDNGIKTLIRVNGTVQNADDLNNLVIRSNFDGQKIYLKDVAHAFDGAEDAKVSALYNGKPATFLVVTKKAGADTIALVDEVNIVLKRFKKIYKNQFDIIVYNNEADKVKKKLEVLSSNAISGLILVIIFLFLFLPGKIGLVASMSLPLAVMATFGFMPGMGMNLDAMTILALVIALGMLVDNSVVISENFARLKNDKNLSSYDAAYTSVKQLWLPISTTAFTTIAAFLPMLVTKGVMGEFIMYIPIIVTLALLISLGESFFLLPMRLRFAGGKNINNNESKKDWFSGFIDRFEKIMKLCVERRYIVFFLFISVLFGSFALMVKGNKFVLFPAEQTEIYVGRLEMPKGTILKETEKEMSVISDAIVKEVGDWQRGISIRSGISTMGPNDPKGSSGDNQGLILIYATEDAKFNITNPVYLDALRRVKSLKANDLTFEARANGPPVGAPINGTIRSNNMETLNQSVDYIVSELSKVPGVRDLKTDDIIGEDEIRVQINYEKVDELGLNVSSIGNAIRTALSGTIASKVTLDNKEVNLHVRYNDGQRVDTKNIESIKVMDRNGNLVPVTTVAKLKVISGSRQLKRYDFRSSKTILGDIDEKIINSQVANIKLREIFAKATELYPGITIAFGGEEESTRESMESLGQALVIALLGIFGLLVFLFKSYLRPLIIMSTIPLGLIGFSVAFFFHNKPISFLAMIGVIGLAGIIVNSGIVLISFIDQLREEGELSLNEILVKASGMRLRAVLVTSLTTISGLIPTAYGVGGNDAMLVPMTLAMAWGLTSGTILTLIWVPCAYGILEDWLEFIKKIGGRS